MSLSDMASQLADVYDRHRRGLLTLAMSIAASREDAEDCVHATMARLCRSNAGEMSDPSAYVFAAVRNEALSLLRRRKRGAEPQGTIFEGIAGPDDDPADAAMQRERELCLRAAVDRLPSEKKQLVVMRIYGNLSFAQIAAVLGEPLSTVASRYQRVLDEIRAALPVEVEL